MGVLVINTHLMTIKGEKGKLKEKMSFAAVNIYQ